ncbi:MAG: hypothetical protein HDT33_10755 [Clostridiales bacterium]|nr:hypothetical protein [Clostridiales bacterium]
MSRKREAIFMGIGILAGLALSGPAAQAADYLTARPTTQTFYVDGRQVQFEAYQIHGNNFVKLRDIGKAVDFGVTYDAATNSVYIDPDIPYAEEITTSAQATPTPSALTEENVRAAILALKQTYPHGAVYPAPYCTKSLHRPYTNCDHCAGWAMLCSDAAFGSLPWRRVDNPRWEDIRAGDVLDYRNEYSGHAIVVIEKTNEYVKVTESGMNNHTLWGGQYPRWWLEQQPGYTLNTRYPQ